MKKILLINNGYPSETNKNYVTYIQTIKACLEGAGFHVDLLVLDSNFTSFFGKYFSYVNYYLKILLFTRYSEYHYIYINNYPYSFLPLIPHFARMNKVVIHWHGDDIFPGSIFSGILNKISYLFIRKNFIHIAPSKYFALEAAKRLNIKPHDVLVSPSGGVNTNTFIRSVKVNTAGPVVRLGFASGLLATKGMDLVIGLLQQKTVIETATGKRIQFHYIAYGKQKDLYEKKLAQFQDIVRHSVYPIDRMVEFYSSIDVLLFPTLRDAESLGLVSLEAMACDVPVVGTDNFALRDTIIDGLTGQKFQMNNIDSFRNAVIECIQKLQSYQPREFIVRNFSREAVIENYNRQLN